MKERSLSCHHHDTSLVSLLVTIVRDCSTMWMLVHIKLYNSPYLQALARRRRKSMQYLMNPIYEPIHKILFVCLFAFILYERVFAILLLAAASRFVELFFPIGRRATWSFLPSFSVDNHRRIVNVARSSGLKGPSVNINSSRRNSSD